MSKLELTESERAEAQKKIDLLNRVNQGDYTPEEETQVREMLNRSPEAALIMADLVGLNRSKLIEKTIEGKSSQIALKAQVKQMRSELGFEQSPLLERMIIDNVIDGWLYMQHIQHRLNYWLNRTGVGGKEAAAYWEKRMNTAQRRFLRACTVLARIRKMNLPTVQVNVAQQQVNQVVNK